MSIHVFALQITSIIASNNTIGVDYWDNPNLVKFAKFVAEQSLGYQVVDEAVYDKAAVRFARMLPTDD